MRKPVQFEGDSLKRLRDLPSDAVGALGHQLDRVQQGLEPDDWKQMKGLGKGVIEIRVREDGGAFRLVYVARFEDAVYVLHVFQKKSDRTAQQDQELIETRYNKVKKRLVGRTKEG